MNRYERIEVFEKSMELCESNARLKSAILKSCREQDIIWQEDDVCLPEERPDRKPELFISEKRTMESAEPYAKKGKKVCVLNFASYVQAGGGVAKGASSQEESLCRISSLYPTLSDEETVGDFYKRHWALIYQNEETGVEEGIRKNRDDCIYTPGVVVFRKDTHQCELMEESDWFETDVITCAAPDLRRLIDGPVDEEELEDLIQKRVMKILSLAAEKKVEVLILGAFGCGVFLNPPHLVAKAFEHAIEQLGSYFETIEFALNHNSRGSLNYEAFSEIAGIRRREDFPIDEGHPTDQISILKKSITKLEVDAIVNAANSGLQAGSGVCGAIFKAAGHHRLQKACDMIGYCNVGSAVVTPAFDLDAKHIIHAVGPKWIDGKRGEEKLLYDAYWTSLELALKNNCLSIGFPLISAGVFGFPVEKAWKTAIGACSSFLEENPGTNLKIVFAVRDDEVLRIGLEKLKEIKENTALSNNNDKTFVPGTKEVNREKLTIAEQKVDAVFFHRPEEADGYLSNWYHAPMTVDGIYFSSMEQYIMYKKCMIFGDEKSAQEVLTTDDTRLQKSIGRNARGYISNVWDGMKQAIAMKGLLAKFSQNEALKEKLLDTGNAYLVECSRTDKVWACGRRLDDNRRFDVSQWEGKNLLGFALMEVRSVLK